MTKINNYPEYADKYQFCVVNDCGAEGIWFYGAWNDINKAIAVATEIGGKVVVNDPEKIIKN